MKFAFSRPTSTAGEQQELFTQFGSAGYAGLQLKANQYTGYVDAPQEFLDKWGGYAGVASGLITMGVLSEEGQAKLRKLIRFAAAVGSERIIFVQNLSRQEADDAAIREFAHIFAEMGQEARAQGVALSLHHHYKQPVMLRQDIETFFAAAGEDAVGLTVDTAHLVKSGVEDVAGLIRDFRHVIDNFHLKDFADGDWRVLGHGKIDFAPIAAAIHAIEYDGWICADEESGGSLTGGMQECIQYMRSTIVQ